MTLNPKLEPPREGLGRPGEGPGGNLAWGAWGRPGEGLGEAWGGLGRESGLGSLGEAWEGAWDVSLTR